MIMEPVPCAHTDRTGDNTNRCLDCGGTVARVVFRSFTECGAWNDPDGVIALFPDDQESDHLIGSYMHHGQHGGADPALIGSLFTVTPSQRAGLVAELESLGYALDIDTVTPGRLPRPLAAEVDRQPRAESFRSLRRNGDALDAVRSRVPFANRSHTLTGRIVFVPVGAIVTRVDGAATRADGDTLAHITVQTPGYISGETITEVITTGALPSVHVSALVRTLTDIARNPATNHAYVVSSFDTPIAWADSIEPTSTLHVPPVRYSSTTGKHQTNITGGYFHGSESARSGRGKTPFGTGWQTYKR